MTRTDLLLLCLCLGLTLVPVWHYFGCGKGGDIQRFIQEWQNRRDTQ